MDGQHLTPNLGTQPRPELRPELSPDPGPNRVGGGGEAALVRVGSGRDGAVEPGAGHGKAGRRRPALDPGGSWPASRGTREDRGGLGPIPVRGWLAAPSALLWGGAALAALGVSELIPSIGPAWVSLTLRGGVFAGAGLTAALLIRTHRRRERARSGELARAIARLGSIGEGGAGFDDRSTPNAAGHRNAVEWLTELVSSRSDELDRRLSRLIEDRAALRAIIDSVEAPVFATDDSGQIQMVNRAGERLFSRRAGRLTGLALEELFTSGQMLDLHERARGGDAVRGQVTTSIGGETRVYEVAASPVRMDIADVPASSTPRAGVVLTLREVTEQAKTAKLRTDFVANASHELRTPIAAIRAAVETMHGAASDDAPMRDRLMLMVEANLTRLEEMTTDLLDLSRLETEDEAPVREAVRASDLAASLRGVFENACEERELRLRFEFAPALERLRIDKRLLTLILRNLISNATKYAFEGTDIVVRGEAAARGDLEVERSGQRGAEGEGPDSSEGLIGAVFTVTDRGEGIPLKHQKRIFERFYQVDPSRTGTGTRRGTGLGLAIVRHAVRRLGGEIGVESVYQRGTTMRVEIPLSVAERGASRRGIVMDEPGEDRPRGAEHIRP